MNYSVTTDRAQPVITARTPAGAILQAEFADREEAKATARKLRADLRAGNGLKRLDGRWTTIQGPKATWRLKGRRVTVREDSDGHRLVVPWSDKLRLDSIAAIADVCEAERIASLLQKRGTVQLQFWQKVFLGKTQD